MGVVREDDAGREGAGDVVDVARGSAPARVNSESWKKTHKQNAQIYLVREIEPAAEVLTEAMGKL